MPTKPKKMRGIRLTKRGLKNSQKIGRPKGTRLKRKFSETRLGFMLMHETPLEYELIMSSTPKSQFMTPNVIMIDALSKSSDDLSFQKPKFKRYLEEYRLNGIYCNRPKNLTPERVKYYSNLRRNKIKTYTVGKRSQLKNLITKR